MTMVRDNDGSSTFFVRPRMSTYVRNLYAYEILTHTKFVSVRKTSTNRRYLLRWSIDDDGPVGVEKPVFVILRRADFRISLSVAKIDVEADFDVRSCVAPSKLN